MYMHRINSIRQLVYSIKNNYIRTLYVVSLAVNHGITGNFTYAKTWNRKL